jgi:UDP-glucuronate decarboxylase
MKILLTGAAGFLGSHLTQKLLEEGHQVTGLDDLSTGSLQNIEKFSKKPNFTFINGDVRNPIDGKYDAILNFACPASPIHYQSDPVKTIETNFMGMSNVLHAALKNNAIVLQASTSEVYGDPIESPQKETYWGNVNPIGVRSCYDEGKRAAETLCFDFKRQYNLDVRVIRIFNTYGPNMAISDGRVVSNFIVQALQGHPITIYGDGKQTRSFCYVGDLVRAIYSVLMLPESLDFPINIGNPAEFTMIELANLIIELTNSKSQIVFDDLPQDDPKQRKPNIDSVYSIVNWSPQVNLRNGIIETISYFKDLLSV